jgi:hypothetical protein
MEMSNRASPGSINSEGNYYTGSSPMHTIENLIHTTPGSAGLDLSPTSWYVLTRDLEVQIIPMGVYGSLPQGREK